MSYDTTIVSTAKAMGLNDTLAKLLAAQARLETNNYTSNVFLNLNNAFGYKYVGQKKWPIGSGTAAGSTDAQGNPDGGHYAKYSSVADSVGEIVDWLHRRENDGYFNLSDIQTPQDYADALKSADYYGETALQYGSDLASTLKKVAIVAGSGLAILLLIAGAFFFNG